MTDEQKETPGEWFHSIKQEWDEDSKELGAKTYHITVLKGDIPDVDGWLYVATFHTDEISEEECEANMRLCQDAKETREECENLRKEVERLEANRKALLNRMDDMLRDKDPRPSWFGSGGNHAINYLKSFVKGQSDG